MRPWLHFFLALAVIVSVRGQVFGQSIPLNEPDTGYRGIWYANQATQDEYVYKYSGGLGTYCAKHIPHAVYAPEVNKTFFVYGGTTEEKQELLEMASYYDHATGEVPRPTIVMNKKTTDAHDNPVMAIDDDGHVWVFASAHGNKPPSYIFKSREPYSTDEFELKADFNYSYPQPWFLAGRGFLFLHTHYDGGRTLNWMTSHDGSAWSDRQRLAFFGEGHYQVSWPFAGKVGTAFNYHPSAFQGDKNKKGLNWRTNLYYLETSDRGVSWQTITGETVQTPLSATENPALIKDYESEGRLCYMKDINYDALGNPLILHIAAATWKPGPEGAPREWRIAHWTGEEWNFCTITTSDNNYDMGSVYVLPDGEWRVIAPTAEGPQRFNPGGEIVLWLSPDQGATWTAQRAMTRDSEFNHTYVRRTLNAHPDFAALWADGHGRQPSDSRLYFSAIDGTGIRQLPMKMASDREVPQLLETAEASN